ncbi:ABC transporter ATP-binding protein [Rhizobium panacihumi]|uniref:ABC transporter ATP-binding protein n=1 Tax=Rhizobium panacihumi TaxID=2008450 RepID=UPI003D7AFE4C
MTFLHVSGLRKQFGNVAALDGVDLAITTGSRTAIVGPSGCGKTTLLRMIAGFDVPDGGSITVDGVPLADAEAQVPAHKRGIGLVAQDGSLFPHLTVYDNVGFGLDRNFDGRERLIGELIDMVGLERAMLARKPDQLSGGQQQRVALARALARKPRLMLLDEPFSALDTGLRAQTRRAVTEVLVSAGITTILVTHDQAEALAFADQVAVMRAGKFAQVGTPREIYARPADAATARFLGEAIVLAADMGDGFADCALGRVVVDGGAKPGRAEIMVRPEQIEIMAYGEGGEGVSGIASQIDFCGPRYDVTITTEGPEPFVMRLSLPSRNILGEGERIRLTVAGPAHVFGC